MLFICSCLQQHTKTTNVKIKFKRPLLIPQQITVEEAFSYQTIGNDVYFEIKHIKVA